MTSRRRRSLKLLPVPRAAPDGAPGTRPGPKRRAPLGPQRPKRFLGDRHGGEGGSRSAVERFRLRGRTGAAGAAGARGQGVYSVRSATSDVMCASGGRPAREVWRDCGRDRPAWRPPAGRSTFVRSRTLRGGSSASCSGARRLGRPYLPEIQTACITLAVTLGRCCAAPVGRLVRRPHVRCRAEARLKRQLLVCHSCSGRSPMAVARVASRRPRSAARPRASM